MNLSDDRPELRGKCRARRRTCPPVVALAVSMLTLWAPGANAESLTAAMAAAYENNPSFNAARAELRATDELLPQAKANRRPSVSAGASYGINRSTIDPRGLGHSTSTTRPGTASVTISQNLFRGFRTRNAIRRAISQINAGRSGLANEEQNTLLDAVEAYMNVVRDSAVVRLNVQNLGVLRQQLRSTDDRFEVGEVTVTDVAQAQAAVQAAISQLLQAESNLTASQALYRQIVGRNPRGLRFPGRTVLPLPKSRQDAIGFAITNHPAIKAGEYNVEAAEYQVKEITGELLPTVSVEATGSHNWEPSSTVRTASSLSVLGRLSIPIYQRGTVSSRVRGAKQTKAQLRLETDAIRDQVRAAVVAAWAGYQAAIGQIEADQAQIRANELALNGVREEERVGQRTTLDVLDAQQELLRSQVNLSTSQRNRVVAAYSLLSAMGKLNARAVGLNVREYNPAANTQAVENKWFGLRIPGGN